MSGEGGLPWKIPEEVQRTPPTKRPTETKLPWTTNLTNRSQQEDSINWKLDLFFAIDCTGSMAGEIAGVKQSVIAFSEIIQDDGINIRLGLIEYRDRLNHEEAILHSFSDGVFTTDIPQFREKVGNLRASGGGPEPESTFDAILTAIKSIEDINRTNALVIITDAPPRIPDKEGKSVEHLIVEIQEMKLDQLYIMYPLSHKKCQVYEEVLDTILGQSFDLRGDKSSFHDALMNLSRTISTNTRIS